MPTFDFRHGARWAGLRRHGARRAGEAGIVGVNLVLVIAFALYAVIMLSRTTLAAKQIDDR
ncbi:MAG: hypothetical protein LC708_02980, partial [Actinobacteria bacterium]|nr:hypothetical protein [Actinomycetota bacterium]